jgi:hypothetical protein
MTKKIIKNSANKISRLRITNGGTKTGITGIYASRNSFLTLEDVSTESIETGFSIISGKNQTIKNITAKSCTKAGLSIKATGVEVYTVNNFTGDIFFVHQSKKYRCKLSKPCQPI